jgi:hypothetical protein
VPKLIQSIPEGPLAIIGDVHGEIGALERLLERIGPGRTLVFVGDLVDRGPDSVAVVRRVGGLIASGRAVATLGNHELNILQGLKKEGNGWFLGHEDHAQVDGRVLDFGSRSATASERTEVTDVLGRMPLVLERADVRVVHAGWDPAAARKLPVEGDAAALATQAEADVKAELRARGIPEAAAAEREEFAELLDQKEEPTRYLANVAEEDSAVQLGNPVKLLTSGAEVPVAPGAHFFAGGKWRFVNRDRWTGRAMAWIRNRQLELEALLVRGERVEGIDGALLLTLPSEDRADSSPAWHGPGAGGRRRNLAR